MTELHAEEGADGGRECLLFNLGGEDYAVDILKVQEIRGYDKVTRIANAPDHIKGVINLRGNIVPIIDMRIKFQLGNVVYDPSTVVIVLSFSDRVVGMVVDGVSDVVTLQRENLHAAPELGSGVDTGYIIGVGVIEGRNVILVEIEKLMNSEELDLVQLEAA